MARPLESWKVAVLADAGQAAKSWWQKISEEGTFSERCSVCFQGSGKASCEGKEGSTYPNEAKSNVDH